MSKVAVAGNNSGTGVFTIAAPNSNTDRTLTLPDEEGTVATIENIPPGYEDQDALDLFNVTGSAPVYACRAWVNFDGDNTTIRDSRNVSSITDNGTGKYDVNFSTDMPDDNYCAQVTAQEVIGSSSSDDGNNTTQGVRKGVDAPLQVGKVKIQTGNFVSSSFGFRDNDHVFVSIFR